MPSVPPLISPHNPPPEPDGPDGVLIPRAPSSPGTPGGGIRMNQHPVLPPPDNQPPPLVRHLVSEPTQMAQLIRRVEPIYPALCIQIHCEGRVELHAVISTAGTIESLEVISGHPLFIQSPLAAVREWRYRPTILNGRPIEVDTHITVIYTLSH